MRHPRVRPAMPVVETTLPVVAKPWMPLRDNGLNDMNPQQGPTDSFVQTPHNQGIPGEAGAGAAIVRVIDQTRTTLWRCCTSRLPRSRNPMPATAPAPIPASAQSKPFEAGEATTPEPPPGASVSVMNR
jgi:hypothetical protein